MKLLFMSGLAALTAAIALPALAQDEAPDQKSPKGPRPERAGKMFEEADADSSGGISLKEMLDQTAARVTERFEMMDANKDGEVTKDEFKPPMRPHRGPKGPGDKGGRKGPPDADAPAPVDAPDV